MSKNVYYFKRPIIFWQQFSVKLGALISISLKSLGKPQLKKNRKISDNVTRGGEGYPLSLAFGGRGIIIHYKLGAGCAGWG